jgi:hypothetical protein
VFHLETYFPMTLRITSRPSTQFSMTLSAPGLIFLSISSAPTLQAQTAPPTPKPSPDVVAGIPVNYDEAKVGTYSLPDPLRLNNGKPVRDAKTWYSKRRPEIVEMFETQQYGRAPGRPADESFEMVDPGTDVWPAATQPIFHDLSYYMHEGGHGMAPSDRGIYLEFLKKTFPQEQ